MAELTELLDKALKKDKLIGSGILTEVIDSVAALEYEGLIDTVPALLPKLGKVLEPRISEIDEVGIDKSTEFVLKYVPNITQKLISSDAEVRNELAQTEDMNFNLKAGNIVEAQVQIKGGQISFSPGLHDERDFFITMSTPKLLRIMQRQDDIESGLIGGGIEMWSEGDEGDMEKAQSFLPLLTVILQKLRL
ncbi:MAG: hypothetical protein SVY53_06905 [Chloroflexota bacterium]|nr:hypothetical protein [Chloroflexota bacterium]